ncbi:MAG TPA: hypothetical protein PLO63_05780 [Syntrophales bacterium]|nr:hypothetical protein [Syntrophales bacterium]
MKRSAVIFFLLSMAIAISGCATMSDISSSVSTTVTSITSNVDPNLVAKVPGDKRGDFPKAEFAVRVADEKLKLAKMKTELAAKQKKQADYEEDLVAIGLKDANLDYDIVKMAAVDAAGLGKKEENIKATTKLKLKKVDLEGDRIKAEGNITTVKQQITDLAARIKAQEEQIAGLTAGKAKPEKEGGAAVEKAKAAEEKRGDDKVAAPAAVPAPATPPAPAEKAK